MINQAVNGATGLLADRIAHYADVTRDVCDLLRRRGEAQPAYLLEKTLARFDSATAYLRSADGTQLYGDMREMTRGRTWMVAGAGLIAGLLAARAIRASATMPHQEDYVEQFDQRSERRG